GRVRGAFTGAIASRRGRFALAGRGTIFLDEIGDTSLEFQTKLLRVLQNGDFQPVGSEETEHTEARVVAATHQPLESMIAERRFREDLSYRLRVVEIVIPTLRERVADIPLLAEHMLRRAATALSARPALLAPDGIARLMEHERPGNVRELENCLMRALVVASGGVIHAEHLSIASPGAIRDERVASLEALERTHVTRVLELAAGHKGRAADLLGVSRPRLNRLIEKYGLQGDRAPSPGDFCRSSCSARCCRSLSWVCGSRGPLNDPASNCCEASSISAPMRLARRDNSAGRSVG